MFDFVSNFTRDSLLIEKKQILQVGSWDKKKCYKISNVYYNESYVAFGAFGREQVTISWHLALVATLGASNGSDHPKKEKRNDPLEKPFHKFHVGNSIRARVSTNISFVQKKKREFEYKMNNSSLLHLSCAHC